MASMLFRFLQGCRSALAAVTCLLALGAAPAHASPAHASTATFTVPESLLGDPLNGISLSGFTFHGHWISYGDDARRAPFMEENNQAHSLSYDAGSFIFQSITLGGLPWENAPYGTGTGTLTLLFRDIGGNLLFSDTLTLPKDNSWVTYSHTLAGVHSIFFPATNDNFWPRLDSITFAIPEPRLWLLLAAGLGLIGLVARRRTA
ncbi:MAG: hypothetical protein LDL44_01190 [Caenispirillum sp.]|nr:hypothetical protein [Caenispirillum sp.]